MTRFSLRAPALAACASVVLVSSAFAQAPADTLARVKETRSITLGVREAARPFSYLNEQKQPVGYSVDLCLAAVDEIKRSLKLPELKVNYKLVAGAERIPKLESGEIDLECGSTTNTKARQEKVAFSYTIFVAGIRVLVPKGTKVETVKDLGGLPVALSKGTTSEKLFTQLHASEVKMQLTTFASNGEAYQALKEGKVRAFPQDDSLLLGLASHDNALDRLDLSSAVLSVEPYAIMMRKGDTALAAVVDRTLARLYAGGEIDATYRKWFATDRLNIAMSRLTRDSFTRPNKESGVAMLLGYSL
ncbi:amino acid ABC transporter substrate-binding protein [Ramlibacter sp. USB13]|uniref:Amino acid ABC transporter substrate-binding protein n=1 Tax=Ramlibacter cellulosilyticus TaxID=2764187 RepID=A0A923MPE4_9BURK|nr:amino acid ABC transporter substrate-binding protein [Ramlibacter cellulosilyticus]MBC5781417.1 amino acid ABC transporter substrate-binding protein [Ramlibacter cellulosilyticus]